MRNGHRRFATRRGGFMKNLSSKSERLVSNVQDISRSAVDGAGRAVESIKVNGRKALKAANRAQLQVRDYINGNPGKSVLYALGLGAVLGYLLRGRRRPE